jgi:hypothetical protein
MCPPPAARAKVLGAGCAVNRLFNKLLEDGTPLHRLCVSSLKVSLGLVEVCLEKKTDAGVG